MHDPELIPRVLGGDPSAQRALYDRHVDRVYRVAYRLAGEETLAMDITQDTFIKAFDRLAEFRGESALSTWLCAIATSVGLNALRSRKRRSRWEADLDEGVDVGAMPAPGDPDLVDRMRAAIAALPDGYRTVFLLHDVEGFTHEEIGRSLGIRSGTSKAQLFRARAKLRDALKDFAPEAA